MASAKQVILVKNVKCNGTKRDLKFTARGNRVVVKSKGQGALVVRPTQGLGKKAKPFEAFLKEEPTFVVMAKTPAKVFAAAVHQFW